MREVSSAIGQLATASLLLPKERTRQKQHCPTNCPTDLCISDLWVNYCFLRWSLRSFAARVRTDNIVGMVPVLQRGASFCTSRIIIGAPYSFLAFCNVAFLVGISFPDKFLNRPTLLLLSPVKNHNLNAGKIVHDDAFFRSSLLRRASRVQLSSLPYQYCTLPIFVLRPFTGHCLLVKDERSASLSKELVWWWYVSKKEVLWLDHPRTIR